MCRRPHQGVCARIRGLRAPAGSPLPPASTACGPSRTREGTPDRRGPSIGTLGEGSLSPRGDGRRRPDVALVTGPDHGGPVAGGARPGRAAGADRAAGRAAVPAPARPAGPPQTGRSLAARLEGPTLRATARRRPRRLLVDDVVTTGSTMSVAGRALRGAGATRVFGVAAAATPRTLGLSPAARSGPWTSP